MKKHYRGKRHVYARKTVKIGRDKKRVRKFNRMLRVFNENASRALLNYVRAMENVAKNVNRMLLTLSEQND